VILTDFSQVVISNILVNIGMNKTDTTINEDLMRHMILNTIRSYKSKFGQEYGRIVICADSKHYWRKDVFAYYKAHRKADREKSKINWNLI
jgi:hypothetical protein